MIIELVIPDTLPEGRRASFKKGIAEILMESATTRTKLEHTPINHAMYREQGREVGRALVAEIQNLYPK